MSASVCTQDQLDAAVARGDTDIIIQSSGGVWLCVSGSVTVRASGSATVTASGSATVTAYGSATVRASGSATVTASGSATVRAYDSATVRASDSATVEAYGSVTVTASGSATVTAYDSASVRAYDSVTVRAYDSVTVRASSSVTVRAYGAATVTASPHVAVHLHSGHARVSGGVLIDLTTLDLADPQTWCDYHGVPVTDGIAIVHKAVGDNWTTSRGTDYSPGALPSCDDWTDDNDCGGGLHFSPHPWQALSYYPDATRYVAVGVALADLRPILGGTPKCKAPRVVVACREVTA